MITHKFIAGVTLPEVKLRTVGMLDASQISIADPVGHAVDPVQSFKIGVSMEWIYTKWKTEQNNL